MKLKLTPTHDLENAQIYDYLIERSTSLDKDAKLPKTHVSHILHRT